MTFILIFGLVWSLLAVFGIGFVLLFRLSRRIHNQSKEKAEARKKEELRRWAEHERANRPEDEETWHRNQEMKMH